MVAFKKKISRLYRKRVVGVYFKRGCFGGPVTEGFYCGYMPLFVAARCQKKKNKNCTKIIQYVKSSQKKVLND